MKDQHSDPPSPFDAQARHERADYLFDCRACYNAPVYGYTVKEVACPPQLQLPAAAHPLALMAERCGPEGACPCYTRLCTRTLC